MIARTLPGIAFRTEPPTQVGLPRMDVAAFVGFAQRGPVHIPVAVESYEGFVDIFGGPVRLARDEVNAVEQTACLAPAIKAFFTQGGRRCWVVRVASDRAETSRFYPPGLLQVQPGGYGSVAIAARSPGSWADDLEVGVELQLTPLAFQPQEVMPGAVTLTVSPPPRRVEIGDLIQLNNTDDGDSAAAVHHRGYGVVQAIAPAAEGFSRVTLAAPHWFRQVVIVDLLATGDRSGTVTFQGQTAMATLREVVPPDSETPPETEPLEQRLSRIRLVVGLTVTAGDWLKFTSDGDRVWLRVAQDGSDRLILEPNVWQEGTDGSPISLTQVQRVRLALRARQEDFNTRLEDLACAAPNPRFLGYLPSDETLFDPRWGQPHPAGDDPALNLRTVARSPRFPLAADLDATLIPLGVETAATWRGAVHSDRRPLERDGLVPETRDPGGLTGLDWSSFWPELYLDPALQRVGQRSLLTEARDRLYLQGLPLKGIHALLPVTEVSLVALPDAAHSGWRLTQRQQLVEVPTGPGLVLWLLLAIYPCDQHQDSIFEGPLSPGQFLLRYLLLSGRRSGTAAMTAPGFDWTLLSPIEYSSNGLLEVHAAAARFAAALGDRVAVLGLPKHYQLQAVRPYQQQLLTELERSGESTASYVALYHPWLISRGESGELVHSHPVGAVCGAIAARSRSRGAWVAPANEVIADALGTIPTFSEADEAALYQASINPIRYTALRPVIWGAFTQSLAPDLEDLNVRRLLILLKRFAAEVGQDYVFAAHDGALRRRVKRQFEQMLGRLFELGAFAGAVPAEAFQVGIDTAVNTSASVEQGRFIVELRVAPSQPLTFITVRLVQQEQESLLTQEVLVNGR